MNTSAACVGLLVAMLCGCSTAPITVRASHVPPTARTTTATTPAKCTVHFASLKDARVDPAYLGHINGRAVSSPGHGTEWIGSLLASGLQQKGIAASFEPAVAPDPRVTIAEARLVTAWVASVLTSMNGSAVLAVRQNPGGEEKIYRGSSTTVNWANGDAEIQRLLDVAVEQMLTKLATDIKARCNSRA
jgi:hypothetical protein